MNISRAHLNKAVNEGIVSELQAKRLWDFLDQEPDSAPKYNLTHVLYYLGGLIAIGAMSLFMTLGFEAFGGWGIFFISLGYSFAGLYLSHVFATKNLSIPAGITASFVVSLTPLTVYGLQLALGLWHSDALNAYRYFHYYIEWQWLVMELATLLVGAVMIYLYRYPFMLMPIAVTLWYMSMDVSRMLTGGNYNLTLAADVSLIFGLVMIGLAIYVDIRSRHSLDYAFWLYLFGVVAFWSGLTSQDSTNEMSRFIYCVINLGMITVGVLLMRRVFVVFGGLGTSIYLGHLAASVFNDSLLFPIALTLIGLLIIYLGVLWQKHEHRITNKLQSYLPKPIQELLKTRQDMA